MANCDTFTQQTSYIAKDVNETLAIGKLIAAQLCFPACVYLYGEMGAGKTTLTKSIIGALGCQGEVTSPTYNLVQEYEVELGTIFHMDVYRIDDPSELEFLAIDDLWSDSSLFLIEWPEKGAGFLPQANFEISISKIFDQTANSRNIILNRLE